MEIPLVAVMQGDIVLNISLSKLWITVDHVSKTMLIFTNVY